MKALLVVLVGLCYPPPSAGTINCTSDLKLEQEESIVLAAWHFEYVGWPLIVTIFIMVSGLLKIIFHWAEVVSSRIPESCLLIAFGAAVGGIIYAAVGNEHQFHLDHSTFFLFILPPIVLESAYSLHDRVFVENLGAILVYAVFGTLINFILIGPTLWGLSQANLMGSLNIGLVDCLLFSSFIVAVDPVSVLAIFQEVHVNNILYFLVFGESLLNDAVTIVLNSTMKPFSRVEEITWQQILIGIGSFFTDSLGGLAIGCLMGFLTALITRTTTKVRVVEPLAILCMAYLAYVSAELFHWSGIISMIGCGLVQAQYAFHNISRKSYTTVIYFMKMLSSACDSVIFMFLGIELVATNHVWNTGFVLWTLLFILVYRAVSTFGLTFLVNRCDRIHKVTFREQFIMFYGGLRGAICFALCSTVVSEYRQMFLTTSIVVIMFTVFVQGISIKPLVSLCHIERREDISESVFEAISKRVVDECSSGIEIIANQHGSHHFWTLLLKLNDHYLTPLLQNEPRTYNEMIVDTYCTVMMKEVTHNLKKGSHPSFGNKNLRWGDSSEDFSKEDLGKLKISDSDPGIEMTVSIDVGPTVDNVEKLLSASTMGREVRQKADRNLIRDEDEEFESQLMERRRRSLRGVQYRPRKPLAGYVNQAIEEDEEPANGLRAAQSSPRSQDSNGYVTSQL